MKSYRAPMVIGLILLENVLILAGQEPPAMNPFAPRSTEREDARGGYVEFSGGQVWSGKLYLTRDTRLKVFDSKLQRQREIPWQRIRQIECDVEKEWMEKEWRFAEAANDRKVFTGRQYPARLYRHVITLTDGRKISGPVSAIVYLQRDGKETKKILIHKRDKGKPGYSLETLTYVKSIHLGDEALAEGRRRESGEGGEQGKAAPKKSRGGS